MMMMILVAMIIILELTASHFEMKSPIPNELQFILRAPGRKTLFSSFM